MRQDIQFLRGLAVLIVVLEHAGIGPSAGYLGVDIFFVISGYLITRLIQTKLEAGEFSFGEFYARRAKRLLPAAFTTFALTALAAPYFLTSIQLDEFQTQLIGSLTFTANIVLYGQSGYFDSEAALKPLLHIWSLSLEEQYYFALPLLLFIVRRRFWPHITLAILVGSVGLCIFYLSHDPSFAFYSLPTRAWELCIGSLVAILRLDVKPFRFFHWVFWPAFAATTLIPFFPTSLPHPSLDAMMICLGTAVVIINKREFFERAPLFRIVSWIGDASYSIYLAHWPIMAFINSAYLSEVPLGTRLISLGLTLTAGLALHYFVERPTHKSTYHLTLPKTVVAATPAAALVFLLLFIGNAVQASGSVSINFYELRKPNYGLNITCDQKHRSFKSLTECTSGPNPTVMIWGDSLAMHLVQGVQSSMSFEFIQATKSSCPPAFGYAQFNNKTKYTESWAHSCVEFNRSVMSYLKANPDIGTVVIGSTFSAFAFDPPWQAVVYTRGQDFARSEIDTKRSVRILRNTVRALRSMGKRVVVFAPPPAGGVNYSECIERELTGKITFGIDSCTIPIKADQSHYGEVRKMLHRVSITADVPVIDPRDWMCAEGKCNTIEDNIPLYRDTLHLSEEGSAFLGKKENWGNIISDMAR